MVFRNRDRRGAIAIAETRARAVLATFDEMLSRAVPPFEMPPMEAGRIQPAARARALGALRDIERSLPALESLFEEESAQARDWHRRAALTTADGRDELSAQARRRAADYEETAAAYAAEIAALRALMRDVAALGDGWPS